ncbi:tetratricopeptide repeat protein [Arthrobacter rhombi]|uniref:tetratricopeptide repeat protein n=1 Tax=Arthrobacter rhombi TaxID=71253 RepID=UPI003FD14C47
MANEIESADYVLVVFTETYARRFDGKETPGVGVGANWEGSIITTELYYANEDKVKFIPVFVEFDGHKFIPTIMKMTTFYKIGTPQDRDLEKLLRHLHGLSKTRPAPIGSLPEFLFEELPDGEADASEKLLADAVDMAEDGKEQEAVELIWPLLESAVVDTRAKAAYTIANIYLMDGQYAASITAFQRALELSPSGSISEKATEHLQVALEIMNSHYGEDGPVHAASEYLQLIQSGKMVEVWKRTEPTLRLVLAQAWIWSNKNHAALQPFDRDELAASLAQLNSEHPLREDFFATQLHELEEYAQSYNEEDWGAAERPRRFGLDYELVIFMRTDGEVYIFREGMSPPARFALMRRVGPTWMTSGFSPDYSFPGWPPTREELPNLDFTVQDPPEPA